MATRTSVTVLTAFFLLTSTVDSIWYGYLATPDEFPHNVLFKVYGPVGWEVHPASNLATHILTWGSGSLLSNEWVITSCQVLQGTTERDTITVSLGVRNRGDESEPGRINLTPEKVINHPNFTHHLQSDTTTYSNDVALVKLPRKIDFTDRIQPVLLPKTLDLFDDQVIVTGWGEVRNKGYADELTWAPYRIVSNPDCELYYQPGDIFNTTICAIENSGIFINKFTGVVIGKYDQGGSLLLQSDKRTLIGVTSFAIRRLHYDPQGFMRITSYLEWIEEITGITAN